MELLWILAAMAIALGALALSAYAAALYGGLRTDGRARAASFVRVARLVLIALFVAYAILVVLVIAGRVSGPIA